MLEFLSGNFQFIFVLKEALDDQLVYVDYIQDLYLSK